jgi:hypothetical protein
MHTQIGCNRNASCCKWYCIAFPLETPSSSPLLRRSEWGSSVRPDCSHSGGWRTCKIKSRNATTKAAIYQKSLHLQIGLSFKKKLVRFYIRRLWSILLYGVETRTLQKGHKYLKSSDTLCWVRIEKISWTESVYSEDVLRRVKEEKKYLTSGLQYNEKKASWMGHVFC